MKKILILKHIGVILLFFIVSFIINKVPSGYIISGGDFYQLININENINRYLFTWFNHAGQGQFNPLTTTYPFYYVQKILLNFGLSYSHISNFLIFQFLILSFYSFYFSQKYLFSKIKYKFIGPFFYSLNLTTITILFYPWVISHHFLIYIFVPLIITSFVKYLNSEKLINNEYSIFILLGIISLPAYNNVSFLFALLFIEGLIFGFFLLLNKKNSIIYTVKKGILLLFGQIFISLIVILPFLSSQGNYSDPIKNTKAFGGDITSFIKSTSSSPLNTFRGIIDNWRYPITSLDPKLINIPNIFIYLASILSIIFIIIILLGIIKKKNNNTDITYVIFLFIFLILIFLVSRLTPPFDYINTIFYKNLTLGLFRSPDKLFIFIPFFICYFFTYFINNELKNSKALYYISLLGIFGSTFYIFTGGIIKQYGIEINGYKQGIVKVPDEYYNVQKIINSNNRNTSILSLPYSVVNSLNWSNYQKWNYIGHDLLHLLYNKNYIYSNGYDHPVLETKISTELFSERNIELKELIDVIKKFGIEYIINHKDIDVQYLGKADGNIKKLVSEDIIKKIESNNFFDLFKVSEDYIYPIIFGREIIFKKMNPVQYQFNFHLKGAENIILKQSHNPQWKLYLEPYSKIDCNDQMSYTGNITKDILRTYIVKPDDNFEKIITTQTGITLNTLTKLNPGVNGKDLQIGQILTIEKIPGENYKVVECENENKFYVGGEISKLWKKSIFEDTHNTHKIVYDYASQWTIDPAYIKANYSNEYYRENPDGSIDVFIIIYFRPQSYFYLGLIISSITLITLFGYFSYYIVKKQMRRKKVEILDKSI